MSTSKKKSPVITKKPSTKTNNNKPSIQMPEEKNLSKPLSPKPIDENTKSHLLGARTRKNTPSIFKIKSQKNTPVVFTLQEVQNILKQRPSDSTPSSTTTQSKSTTPQPKKSPLTHAPTPQPQSKRHFGAASVADILGFNPKVSQPKPANAFSEDQVPKHLTNYYHTLIKLRQKVQAELELHASETLKRSSKDDSGDLSSYGQHMADAGTDTFDRDFAFNLLSMDKDLLFEIEEALRRILDGSYGTCEITGQPISKERLEAVPFTRYSLEGQKQLESNKQRSSKERSSLFADNIEDDQAPFEDDEDTSGD